MPQLFDFFDRAGLSFGRWVRLAPYLPQGGTLVQTPHGERLTKLPPAEQYAAVELLRGTMVRHNAVVYRKDRLGDGHSVRFDDERWQDYVPIRLPRTLCIEERLPAGAAAVLINQSHTYSDLVLPIDLEQKRLFEAIDGQRTIAEIMDLVPDKVNHSGHSGGTPTFFERLWWYDQEVFDASQAILSDEPTADGDK